MCSPAKEWFYQAIGDWVWDKHVKVMGNRIVTTLKKLGHITDFICAKQLLECDHWLPACRTVLCQFISTTKHVKRMMSYFSFNEHTPKLLVLLTIWYWREIVTTMWKADKFEQHSFKNSHDILPKISILTAIW